MPSNNNNNSTNNNQNPKYIESLSPECTNLRLKYDTCFNDWFKNVFLSNDTNAENKNDKICEFEFVEYQKCLFKSIEDLESKTSKQQEGSNHASALPKGLLDSIKEAEKEIEGFEKN